MSRSSSATGRPNSAASGSAVCWARSRGLDPRWVTSCPCNDSAAALAIWIPSSDSRYPGRRPYRILVGLWTSPWRRRWTTVSGSATSGLPRGCRQRFGEDRQRGVVDRGRDEPGLVRAGRQVHAAAQHRVEEGPEGGLVLGLRAGEVGDLGTSEEHREHVAGRRQPVRYPGRGQRLGRQLADRGGGGVQRRVDLGRGEAEAGQARGAGERVAGQGTG